MKLNKIASLALAGLMAVGMLAGCSSEPADNGDDTDPVASSAMSASVIATMNDKNANAKARNVAAGADITSQLEAFVKFNGDDQQTATTALSQFKIASEWTGLVNDELRDEFVGYVNASDYRVTGMMTDVDVNDTKTVAQLYAVNASVDNDKIVEMVAETVAPLVAGLPTNDTLDETTTNKNGIKVTYDYTVSVACVEDSVDYTYLAGVAGNGSGLGVNGGTIKYVAIVITGTPVAHV